MNSSFFAYLNRLTYIMRWSLMRNTVSENVAEHSMQAATVAHALALISNVVFKKAVNADKVCAAALYHDCSEILTGDLPTPIKYYNAEMKNAYKKIENNSINMLIETLPKELRAEYAKILYISEDIVLYIKAADKLCALIKCIDELKSGNNEFKKAFEQVSKQVSNFSESDIGKEVDYFVDNFIKPFYLTLDEL